jgi:hypothetical protein
MLSPNRRLVLTTGLALTAAALLFANAAKYGLLSERFFTVHEKTIDGVGKLLGAMAILLGSIASYFRFFKGRTFSAKADLEISVTVIPTTSKDHLHVISVRLKNIGPVPIWDPRIRFKMIERSSSPSRTTEITGWRLEDSLGDGTQEACVVDSQEHALYHSEQLIDKEVWAVRYEIAVQSSDGDTWYAMSTVPNKVSEKASA